MELNVATVVKFEERVEDPIKNRLAYSSTKLKLQLFTTKSKYSLLWLTKINLVTNPFKLKIKFT